MDDVKKTELEIMKTLHYKIASPTVLEFLRIYLKEVIDTDGCEFHSE